MSNSSSWPGFLLVARCYPVLLKILAELISLCLLFPFPRPLSMAQELSTQAGMTTWGSSLTLLSPCLGVHGFLYLE